MQRTQAVWVIAAGFLLAIAGCGDNKNGVEPPAMVSIGGSVSGLAGTGLVLEDNNGDELAVNANGTFTFATKLAAGSAYHVTVKQQPVMPSQTCIVAASSVEATSDVTDIAVTCTTNSYAIGGTVTGLLGSGLVLRNNGGDDRAISADGTFAFATAVASGATYTVSVATQPSDPTQTCTVSGGSGTVGGGDVATVVINCDTNTYTVGGTVSGLTGTGLVLQNNAGDDLPVTANGTFAFATPIASGAAFAVTVKTQPASPSQTCSVTMGTGTIAAANVTTVSVQCSTNTYDIGGAVSGLVGSGLVLQDNLGDDLPVAADGSFTFATALASGTTYAVTVLAQPSSPSQTCTVANGTGLVTSANVTDVAVTCTTNTYTIGGTVTGLQGTGLVLRDNGGDDLPISADGTFTFTTPVASDATFTVTAFAQPTTPWQTCTISGGSGTVTAANITSVVVNCDTNQYAIGGTVTGLDGTGLAVSLDGGTPVPLGANGTWAFSTTRASGATYTVTITGQPVANSQTCTLSNPTGTVAGADVTSVDITCTTNRYAVGGSVAGLAGGGLTLHNGTEDLPVAADGTFAFTSKVASGQPYAVTVSAQPTDPWQTCTVTGASGTVTTGDITDVAVTCTTNKYVVGGTLTGLAGTVVLQDNAGDDLMLTANGPFQFATKLTSGSNYVVTVLSQPNVPSQTCTVTANSGAITNADISSVVVTCVTNTYSIGGSVTGLVGTGLVLHNGAEDLPIAADGTFTFTANVASGQPYAVTVSAQPSGPSQTCMVSGDSGVVGSADVTSVVVNCTTNAYTIGGTLSGLNGATGLVLQNNLGDDRPLSADGAFAFATPIASGAPYSVTVETQPTAPWETCTITNESGTVTNADIGDVQVSCTPNHYAVRATVTGLIGGTLVLQNNGGDNLSFSGDGTLVFNTPIASGATYNVTVLSNPPGQTCTVDSPTGVMPDGVALAVHCIPNAVVFTASGTFTVPAGVTSVHVLVVGGGGGGDNGHQAGGAGGYVAAGTFGVSGAQAIAVTVGAGGLGAQPCNGCNTIAGNTAGGASSFGALISAAGGATNSVINAAAPAGGTGGGGSCNAGSTGGNGGTNGGNGTGCSYAGGAGQGATYGAALIGFGAHVFSAGAGGTGGNTSHAGGGGGGGVLIDGAGPSGQNGQGAWTNTALRSGSGGAGYGAAGGAGGFDGSNSIRMAGGNGAAGVVYVEW